jgi:CheY-like chemotaxis protein
MNQPVIFYADDDIDDLLLFREAADDFPGTVITFENGDKMVSSLQDFMPKPSIIFVDLNMPLKSGFEVVREIRQSEHFHHIPVIVLSTASDHFNVDKVRRCGADYYIPKPSSFSKLRSSLQYALSIDWRNFNPPADGFLHQHGAE